MTVIDVSSTLGNFQVTNAGDGEHYLYSGGQRSDLNSDVDWSQSWFWTEEWQAGEREADADIAQGRFTRYQSDEDFLASL